MAAVRNSIVHALADIAPNLAAAMRRLNYCFTQALSFLGLPQLE